MALNKVLFPTFGKPTIPTFNIPGYYSKLFGRGISKKSVAESARGHLGGLRL